MYKKLFFFLLLPVLGMSQVQIGQDIEGEDADDQNGYSVSLSSDGSIVAIGSPNSSKNGLTQSGHVRIFQNISGNWTQIGNKIEGTIHQSLSGRSVSLSSAGNIIAIGAPLNNNNGISSGQVSVYENISGVWTQIGNDINGMAAYNTVGYSISLSSDGSVVAISNGDTSVGGFVQIFKNISGVWTQIGNNINGESAYDGSGFSVSLSSDGSVVAIGATNNSGNGGASGHVRIYKNISGVWTQVGADIDGEATGDKSGFSVSLSSNGNIVAIGAPNNSGNGNFSGHVRIYENISGEWTQIGADIDGEATGDQSGYSVSLSSDGNTVAIGAPYNAGNGANAGHVRIYKNISGKWIQAGSDIDGIVVGENNGHSVSLSSDGKTVAIGTLRSKSLNGFFSGFVRIYDISNLSSNDFVLENFNIYPNPTSDVLNINLENNLTLEKVTIYNNAGQVVKEVKEATVDVSTLSEGIYFVEVTTNQGKAVKKIIVK